MGDDGENDINNKNQGNKNNNGNYMERMKRKWTKFKQDMGIKPRGALKEEKHTEEKPEEIGGISLQNKEENGLIEESKSPKKEIMTTKQQSDGNENKSLYLVKSDFRPIKHPIGQTVFDMYAPQIKKVENEEIRLEIEEDEKVLKNLMRDEKFEEGKNEESDNENKNEELKGEPVLGNNILKKNSIKNRNCGFLLIISFKNSCFSHQVHRSGTTIGLFPRPPLANKNKYDKLRIIKVLNNYKGSISQSEKSNKIDNFERNPKFMNLLKEMQQSKIEIDDDYMKTTKELGK